MLRVTCCMQHDTHRFAIETEASVTSAAHQKIRAIAMTEEQERKAVEFLFQVFLILAQI